MFAGFAGIAYSPSHFILKICVFLFGLGGGAINGSASALVSDISDKDKGANLSILGVFFAIGALGMPFILGIMENRLSYTSIVSFIGTATLIMGIIFLVIQFPVAKQAGGIPASKIISLIKDPFLLLISFFLFFQSAFEGLINNWTPTYLTSHSGVASSRALFALSASVAGMTVMRLLLGSILRKTTSQKIWLITFLLLLGGLLILLFSKTYYPALAGFILIGGGLAAGFPIMLGYVGDHFSELSGTAFSIAFSIALLGNMIINFGMGYIAQNFGISHLVTVGLAEAFLMVLLCLMILKRLQKY